MNVCESSRARYKWYSNEIPPFQLCALVELAKSAVASKGQNLNLRLTFGVGELIPSKPIILLGQKSFCSIVFLTHPLASPSPKPLYKNKKKKQ